MITAGEGANTLGDIRFQVVELHQPIAVEVGLSPRPSTSALMNDPDARNQASSDFRAPDQCELGRPLYVSSSSPEAAWSARAEGIAIAHTTTAKARVVR
jgi:hypothetical protein